MKNRVYENPPRARRISGMGDPWKRASNQTDRTFGQSLLLDDREFKPPPPFRANDLDMLAEDEQHALGRHIGIEGGTFTMKRDAAVSA